MIRDRRTSSTSSGSGSQEAERHETEEGRRCTQDSAWGHAPEGDRRDFRVNIVLAVAAATCFLIMYIVIDDVHEEILDLQGVVS